MRRLKLGLILISFDDKDLKFSSNWPATGNNSGNNICSLNHQIGREINNKIKKFYSLNLLKSISSLYPVFKLSKSKLIFHLRASTDGNNYFLLAQLRAVREPKLMKVEKIPEMCCNLSHIWQSIKLFFNLMTRYWWEFWTLLTMYIQAQLGGQSRQTQSSAICASLNWKCSIVINLR